MDPRQELIEVGRQLHEKNLLVRTWGNISTRLDKNYMLITPSGIRYEDLTPDKIVKVRLRDLKWEGAYKPSSEMMVHAACYNVRPRCRFIIHTHQVYATVAGSLGIEEIKSTYEGEDVHIHCAPYALPGTRKLAENVAQTLRKNRYDDCVIMANHGTVCLGELSEETVEYAMELEEACRNFLRGYCRTDIESGILFGYNSCKRNGKILYEQPDTPYRVRRIHEEIYEKRPDVRYIVHNKSEACRIVSRRSTYIRPLLDDFAQIVGVGVPTPFNFHGQDGQRIIVKKHVNAVFCLDDGAYCLGKTRGDAEAVALVLDKGCIAQIAAARYGAASYLSRRDCYKMNRHYRNVYSKLAEM